MKSVIAKSLIFAATAIVISACSGEQPTSPEDTPTSTATDTAAASETDMAAPRLDAVLAAQPDKAKARYAYRHPKETLEFFGIKPGMTVADVLPGGSTYYGNILVPYLGTDGTYMGIDYSPEMWKLFGGFVNEKFLTARQTWTDTWSAKLKDDIGDDSSANISAFVFGALPEDMKGTLDAIIVVRAFHHLNRFEGNGNHRTTAIQDMYDALKPGGIVGVVQHRAPEENDDTWADGNNGYVKQSLVVSAMEAGGFEFIEASEVNANAKDKPTNDDTVWRLPPTLRGYGEDADAKAAAMDIGESDRMTLKFQKPE